MKPQNERNLWEEFTSIPRDILPERPGLLNKLMLVFFCLFLGTYFVGTVILLVLYFARTLIYLVS